nr:hypothetical protein [Tanacetum cinerariifolium]
MTSTTNKSCYSWQKRSTEKTTRCADKADLRWELESKFADARGNSVLSVRVMRKKKEIQRRPSPIASSRDTRFSQGTSVFSRLKHDKEKLACQRSPVSTTVFTRLGYKDKNLFARLGEKRRSVHSRLGPEAVSRRRHAKERRSASTGRSGEDLNRRKKEARDLIRSYVTCSSERQIEIEREWDATDRVKRAKHARTEETYLSENEHDRGGHWKSISKKQNTSEEEDLS